MKDMAKDVLLFTIIALSFATLKIVKGVNYLIKPKVYFCAKCKSQIKGTGINIGKHTICLTCFTRGKEVYETSQRHLPKM